MSEFTHARKNEQILIFSHITGNEIVFCMFTVYNVMLWSLVLVLISGCILNIFLNILIHINELDETINNLHKIIE